MPCSDGREPWRSYVDTGMKERLDLATKIACAALTFIEDDNDSYSVSGSEFIRAELGAEASVWWEQHKKDDAERKAKLKETALSKLTPEEREALGV